MDSFDFVIVGAGSAGCVLADRLTACGRHRVLLLEAGGTDRHPWVRLPIGYGKAFHNDRLNWRYRAAGSAGLGGREMYWPRGKVLGGSSSINGLVWMRGLPHDFDDWERAGNPGWGWRDVAPVFDEVEQVGDGTDTVPRRVNVAARGQEYHPVRHHFMTAAETIGLPHAPPHEAHMAEGVGPYSITTLMGLRHSAANAFLRPAMRRANLSVRKGVLVERVLFSGKRAVGVAYRDGDARHEVRAAGAVILAAGAVASPTLLQRSGIGPSDLLSRFGIEQIHQNAAVGAGLQDHLGVDYLFRTKQATLNQTLGTWTGRIKAALQFLLTRDGPLSLSINQMGGLVRGTPDAREPDLQLYFSPLSYTTVHKNKRVLLKPDPWPGLSLGFNACRPTSQGRVDISSADAAQPPRIAPNYLATTEDERATIAGGRVLEQMLNTPALQALIDRPNGFTPVDASDEAILADFRARASTVFHACGTCRMAPEAAGGVVDPKLRVHGVEGLRVVDASIFPNITSANTNAPTIMVAAKAAGDILAGPD
ncbi:GMC family oxidoreductase [Candidatus Rhodobacter oscarellae]|uniref:GMC family oxidoreductase n=1 Tax=Candidatus Rhodobacter oscarellae TaxID=1675527 RepID=UPI000670AA4B|nr:GMC family oxidoreductase N-terminal domain-containing protein [Candidatus Rhodobacter lobularis]